MKKKIKNYFINSSNSIRKLHLFEKKIIKFVEIIINIQKKGNKLLIAGNGGSCADAEHFTGELQCTFKSKSRKPISALAITGTSASLTAWGNDFNFKSFFKRQIIAHGKANDILVLLSTSGGTLKGSSSNLVIAGKEAKKRGLKVVSFVGKKGGELKKISDLCFHVKNNTVSIIQEAHMSLLHCVCEILEVKLKK
jgi:D-sedoheptulose 7-phosphate isomerase